jgi:lysozyme family protein
MTDLVALKAANVKRWQNAKIVRSSFAPVAKRLVAQKARYKTVEAKTGVPWFIIAVIHERESSQDFATHLGQGDPLNQKTVHVPAGRGPFFGPDAWERGAVDALADCQPYLARKTDWSLGGALTNLEAYNGLRYANDNRPSPYVWAGTSVYDPPTGPGGKVLVDHGPIENVVDKQLGCAGLILAMMAIDPTITFTSATIKPVIPGAPAPVPPPAVPAQPAPSGWAAFFAVILSIFKGKS